MLAPADCCRETGFPVTCPARGRLAERTYRKQDICRKLGGLERLLREQLLRKRRYPMDETSLRDFKQ
jgi:hypothetical protein